MSIFMNKTMVFVSCWIVRIVFSVVTMTAVDLSTTTVDRTGSMFLLLAGLCGAVFGYPLIHAIEARIGTMFDHHAFSVKYRKPYSVFVFACIVVIITFFANHVSSETVKILLKSLGAFIYFFGYLTTRIEGE